LTASFGRDHSFVGAAVAEATVLPPQPDRQTPLVASPASYAQGEPGTAVPRYRGTAVSADDAPEIDRLDQPAKFRVSRSEATELRRLAADLSGLLRTPVDVANVGRAFLLLLGQAEHELRQQARRTAPSSARRTTTWRRWPSSTTGSPKSSSTHFAKPRRFADPAWWEPVDKCPTGNRGWRREKTSAVPREYFRLSCEAFFFSRSARLGDYKVE
jgi:hypothetical protein